VKIHKNKQFNKILNNDDNFNIDQLTIKGQEDWNFPRTISPIFKSNNNSVKSSYNKGKYIKNETNQKLIFNNVGIHYHKAKINRGVELDKKNILHDQEINKLQNTIYTLLKKNSTLESEKAERDNKIEILEEKIEKLMNFIKEKNMVNEDGEKEKLINKVNSLENTVEYLKSELSLSFKLVKKVS
jgi:predicted RNase H-like nuclease (RuvC/YqgF family)